jgi:hypothetical protein
MHPRDLAHEAFALLSSADAHRRSGRLPDAIRDVERARKRLAEATRGADALLAELRLALIKPPTAPDDPRD